MKPLSVLSLLALGLFSSASLAQQARSISAAEAPLAAVNAGSLAVSPSGFEENKGQVTTIDGTPAPHVRFRLTQGGTAIFLLGDGIAFQFNRTHRPPGMDALETEARHAPRKQKQLDALRKEVRRETFRMDMLLDGAAPNPVITTGGRSHDYVNYYTHDALDVRTYDRVTYHDVYPGIDWVLYTTAQGMEHDFVVRPGADPSLIRLRFKDHEELRVEADGSLVQGNRMGRFTEERPVSFQEGREVATRFVLEDDPGRPGQSVLHFALDDYDPALPLTIDPVRVWGTYFGGDSYEHGWSCKTDGSGNVYMTCITMSATAIADGGYQNTYGENGDAALVKFSPAGVRLWATYYGETGADSGWSCAVDGDDNVYLAGTTSSTSGMNSPGYPGYAGYNDAFLVKFDAAGTRIWATCHGGTDYDTGDACAVDDQGNVYLAGWAASTTGIASGGHQNTYGGGEFDAYLAKYDASGNLLWATYYGGSEFDVGESCAVDGSGNVYLAGYTSSTDGIAHGGHQTVYGGGEWDAFLVKYDASGNRLWATYYGGDDLDQAASCSVASNGQVYLAGETRSDSNIAYQGHENTKHALSDAFLVKFDASGTRLWGTYYGGHSTDWAGSCHVDDGDHVYLTGFTFSTAGIAYGGYQDTTAGGGDAFLAKFDEAGTRLWGTYYGGDANDIGMACATHGDSLIYLVGYTDSWYGIASGGHQNVHGGLRDAFLVRFGYGCPTLQADIGDACDDGDANTEDDVIDANCECHGTPITTFDCPALQANIGDSCDDGDAGTENDEVDANCECHGTPIITWDCPALQANIGDGCDDGDAGTDNDEVDANCECHGTPIVTWDCPALQANIGDGCDDGDAGTEDDEVDANCECHGTPIGGPCTGNQVIVHIYGGDADDLTWVVVDAGGNTLANGSGVGSTEVCLGAGAAWYGFRMMDGNGDGISGGGWELATLDGRTILRDAFSGGNASPLSPSASGAYGDAHSFALPLGPVDIAPHECGVFGNLLSKKFFAVKQTGAQNYQFEFSDPDAGFIRRIARPYNYVVLSDIVTNPLVPGVRYFARVRTDKDGPMAQAHWGAGCEMGIGTAVLGCPELISCPAYGHSCNEERSFNTNNSFIYATPITGATEYQFRISNVGEQYDETFTRSTYILQLKWGSNVAGPLKNGYSYNVEVNAKVNGLWTGFCPSSCAITINNALASMPDCGTAQHLVHAGGQATLWPNPVREGQVNLNIEGIRASDQRITVDIKDILGQHVFGQEFGNSGDRFSTVLYLPGDITSGVYLVNIAINGELIVKRLSIVR